ncbi:MAG: adenylate/guanylate cyclase domain-containing protein [Pseudomonadota bacterium]|nr:adenylate/guanylate cyclase domain-containing protein [Pseudomonadota bacterium]
MTAYLALSGRGGPFLTNDEQRLQAFGAQAAVALENARLFREVLNERNYNESILRSLSTGVITLNAERELVKANEAVLRFMGWTLESVLQRSAKELLGAPSNGWLMTALDAVIESGEVQITVDAELHIGEAKTISVNASVVPLIDVSECTIGYMMILEDISAEKRLKSTMARYMTKEVADKLLESGAEALGGTAQEATVLFSDIRRFTTLAEQLGPRETVAMLNDYFTEMVEVIFAHNGILDKYIGDAIMALFGTPFSTGRDADNALQVANLMIARLRQFNQRRHAAGLTEIQIGVGISSGELIAGNIGSPKRMDYTVIGDTVNLSARLESATKYYDVPILFSEDTLQALVKGARRRQIDLIRVKGRQQPVAVFEALDHHDQCSFPQMDEALAHFSQGLERYHARDWMGAARSFDTVLQLAPEDGPSHLYLKRCQHYAQTPPEEGWDGVWVMTGK